MASSKQPTSNQASVNQDEHIKCIISETIKELHANDAVQVTRPKTLQGWVYVIVAIGGVIGFMWTGIVKLNDIAKHAEEPHHKGVEKLVEKFQQTQLTHENDRDLHRTEAELQLMLIRETEPLKEDLNSIKQDVREIQKSVDILVEDNRRNKNKTP